MKLSQDEKKDIQKFFSVSGEKRKCMKCKAKKEQDNGNVFFCNKCKPAKYIQTTN